MYSSHHSLVRASRFHKLPYFHISTSPNVSDEDEAACKIWMVTWGNSHHASIQNALQFSSSWWYHTMQLGSAAKSCGCFQLSISRLIFVLRCYFTAQHLDTSRKNKYLEETSGIVNKIIPPFFRKSAGTKQLTYKTNKTHTPTINCQVKLIFCVNSVMSCHTRVMRRNLPLHLGGPGNTTTLIRFTNHTLILNWQSHFKHNNNSNFHITKKWQNVFKCQV